MSNEKTHVVLRIGTWGHTSVICFQLGPRTIDFTSVDEIPGLYRFHYDDACSTANRLKNGETQFRYVVTALASLNISALKAGNREANAKRDEYFRAAAEEEARERIAEQGPPAPPRPLPYRNFGSTIAAKHAANSHFKKPVQVERVQRRKSKGVTITRTVES